MFVEQTGLSKADLALLFGGVGTHGHRASLICNGRPRYECLNEPFPPSATPRKMDAWSEIALCHLAMINGGYFVN